MPSTQSPIITLAGLHRALSEQRLDSYTQESDRDEVDRVARYMWNMALSSALHSTLHIFEVTLRNAIFNTSVKLVDTSKLQIPDIPCWLDAENSTLLYENERAEVRRAKTYLSTDAQRRTPGHLIAKLTFGFWVQLTARVYNELRADGPRLWPRGLPYVFPFKWPMSSKKIVPDHGDREMIFDRLHEVRELRNRIAHHEPLWDIDLQTRYDRMLEILGWMSVRMHEAVSALDTFPAVLASGHQPYRPSAERLLLGKPAP
ncbi:Abi family protein [Longimicrobium sp.]|uniref:Abi family protein n=1 Tax=Longimicrobium sp. TaxID=2029185 RepID=UPI003B3B9506